MTTYEVNDDTDAADLDVRSVMELGAAGSEVGIMLQAEVSWVILPLLCLSSGILFVSASYCCC